MGGLATIGTAMSPEYQAFAWETPYSTRLDGLILLETT